MENKIKGEEVIEKIGGEYIVRNVKIISDGTRKGTKVFLDDIELRNDHWGRLIFEFDFPLEKWTLKAEFLPFADWPSPLDKE